MLEPRGDADLAAESLRTEAGRQLRVQDFDGDRTAMLRILGPIDGRHAAPANLLLQCVLCADCCLELVERLRSCHPGAVL